MESSLAGSVAETHDLLFESPLSIIGQIVLPIEHCIAGPADVALEEITTIHSHPMALDQCREFLASLPSAVAVAAATTATAAGEVAERGDPRTPRSRALARPRSTGCGSCGTGSATTPRRSRDSCR